VDTIIPGERIGDRDLEQLLHDVYVGGGFTDPEIAPALFAAGAVRGRGRLLGLQDSGGALAGTIIVVPPTSAAKRLAAADEAELHLLAVRSTARQSGLGRRLVEAALAEVRALGLPRVVLWTQPAMHAAQRLYERCGFVRAPDRDFVRETRAFRVYERAMTG